jgi:hypothetical protein
MKIFIPARKYIEELLLDLQRMFDIAIVSDERIEIIESPIVYRKKAKHSPVYGDLCYRIWSDENLVGFCKGGNSYSGKILFPREILEKFKSLQAGCILVDGKNCSYRECRSYRLPNRKVTFADVFQKEIEGDFITVSGAPYGWKGLFWGIDILVVLNQDEAEKYERKL